jgi:hypothetical protein
MRSYQKIILASVLLVASHTANTADYYWCETTHVYFPAAPTCPVPWRKVTVPPAANQAPAQQPSIPAAPAPVAVLAPVQIAPTTLKPTATFQQGLADRGDLEAWFSQIQGDYHEGALYWSGQRSLPHPCSCTNPSMSQPWQDGCVSAQTRLARFDERRRLEPDYKRGWNSWSAPASAQVSASARAASALANTALPNPSPADQTNTALPITVRTPSNLDRVVPLDHPTARQLAIDAAYKKSDSALAKLNEAAIAGDAEAAYGLGEYYLNLKDGLNFINRSAISTPLLDEMALSFPGTEKWA